MLHIYLPEDYEKEIRYYPVLYILDGHNLFYDENTTFGGSQGLKQWLDEYTIPLIAVGVECNYERNRRLEGFSSCGFNDVTVGLIHGQGKELMEWMSSDPKRWINHAYQTLPEKRRTAIDGSPMGGLTALYAVAHHCDICSRMAVLSLPIYRLKDELLIGIRARLKLRSRKIYTPWGSDELRTKQQLALASGRVLRLMRCLGKKEAKVYPNLVFKGRYNEGSWEQELNTVLTWLFIGQKSGHLKSVFSVFTAEYSQPLKRA